MKRPLLVAWSLIGLSSIASAAFAATPETVQRNSCPFQSEWVRQDSDNKALIFPGAIGAAKLSILIDTGSPLTIIDEGVATSLNLQKRSSNTKTSYGGDIVVRDLSPFTMSIANATITMKGAGSTDFTKINAGGNSVNVLLGRDILALCAITIDADNHQVRIGNPPPRSLSDKDVPLTVGGQFNAFRLPIEIDGRPDMWAELDTGAQESFVTDSNTWTRLGVKSVHETSAVSVGLGGFFVEGLAFLPTMKLGNVTVDNVETRIAPAPPSTDAAMGTGTIGLALLTRFNSVIDVRNGVVRLRPRKTAPPSTDKSTSGVMALPKGDRLQILHIMRNSPAAELGLTDKDEICRIDGQPIPGDYFRAPVRIWSKDKPGRVVSLTLCDGRQKQLTLKAFY